MVPVHPLLRLTMLSVGVLTGHCGCGSPNTTTLDLERKYAIATGTQLPAERNVIAGGDTHDGLHGDGEFYLVYSTSSNNIKQQLASPPPFGDSWLIGPVPSDIGFHCTFGTEGVTVGMHGYQGNSQLSELLGSSNIQYAVCGSDTANGEVSWHNGRIFIIDEGANEVWLSVWAW
jgi:hypothetical protein